LLASRLPGVLGLVPPDDHGEERRLLVPSARHRHPEDGPGDAALGVADLEVVGEVAGEAHARLGHDSALLDCLAGRSALPEALRPYDLRHTCASLLIAQGASVKAVQAQLGHATTCITLDTYGHLFPSEPEALADRLEQTRMAVLANRERTQRGPAIVTFSERAAR